MIPRARLVVLTSLLLAAVAVCASAQETDLAEEQARFRLGPLRFTPSMALSNLGVDDNVFNTELDPKRDTTGAIGPAVNLWMRAGRSRLTGQLSGQYLYFHKFQGERAWNTNDELKWELPLGRVTPFIGGTYSNTKDRSGYEIDSRARQQFNAVRLGTSVRLSAITSLVLTGTRSTTAFDEDDERFSGAVLATALNRTSQSEELQLRFKLTTLTTLVLGADAVQDRFEFDSIRNADSIRIMPGFELRPSALVSGRVFVGYRHFDAVSQTVPDYQGPIAAVDATYITGPTRFGIKVSRDLNYSFEATQPYYALTDLGLVVTERITHVWDVVGRAGRQTLNYKQLQAAAGPSRTDNVRQYGGGVGYRLGQTIRFGFDAIYYRRHSSEALLRDFKGLRFGGSVTYGLPQ